MKKHIKNILAVMLLALSTCLITSCGDDNDDPTANATAISQPQIELVSATQSTLSFKWAAVEGATQYGYYLYDANQTLVEGGVIQVTNVDFSGLQMLKAYTLNVYAYPSLENSGKKLSDVATLTVTTPFYTVLNNNSGTLASAVTGSSYKATISEERATAGQFGTFTIKSFYGVEGKDLVFTVNADNTINIQNGTRTEGTRIVTVQTGVTDIKARAGIKIDESASKFDRANNTLTYKSTATRGTATGTDTYTWTEN